MAYVDVTDGGWPFESIRIKKSSVALEKLFKVTKLAGRLYSAGWSVE